MADFLVALTGGIASGKSTVGSFLAELGATVIDSDQVAREVVINGSHGADQIIEAFGQALYETGELDRKALAELVFGDNSKRKQLEQILHPLIQSRSKQLFSETDGIVVYMIPLLVESESNYAFDAIVTVEAGEDNQLQRLMEFRGMKNDEALMRINSQATRHERIEVSDIVIDSNCDIHELEARTKIAWNKLVEMSQR